MKNYQNQNYNAEIIGLSALVNQETELMRAENEERHNQGYSPSYTMEKGFCFWASILAKILEKRFLNFNPHPKKTTQTKSPK